MKQILCNKYEVLRVISEGGMGKVFLVRDLHLNKLAAVKHSNTAAGDEKEEVIRQEMEVLKKLSHPALPAVIDFFREEMELYIVMEYVEGITLEQYLRKFGKVECAMAVRWAVELAEVLDYLHSSNPPVIYRDLKPANIMVQSDGRLKLIDFGAAFVADYGQKTEYLLMGTPGYSAPEQWQSRGADRLCDIYALGIVLREMLTGIGPRIGAEYRSMREYDRGIPRELEKIVQLCTRKKKEERFSTMQEVRGALLGYRKMGRRRRVLFALCKLPGIALSLAAAGSLFLPLLRGIPKDSFPLPFLYVPAGLGLAAALYWLILIKKSMGSSFIRKQEKSIFLTEKKLPGIYVSLVLIGFLLGVFCRETAALQASAEDRTLFVEMRDEYDRKLLLKEGEIYSPRQNVKLEIPLHKLPEGRSSLQVVAAGSRGEVYLSRIFLFEHYD